MLTVPLPYLIVVFFTLNDSGSCHVTVSVISLDVSQKLTGNKIAAPDIPENVTENYHIPKQEGFLWKVLPEAQQLFLFLLNFLNIQTNMRSLNQF